MKNEKISDKDVFEDLDERYQRAAEIEKGEEGETAAPKEEEPKPKKKQSPRSIFIAVLIVCIMFAGILLFSSLKQIIVRQPPKASFRPPLVAARPVTKPKPPAPPPVPKEQEPIKATSEETEKPKPVPPAPPLAPKAQQSMKTAPQEIEKPKSGPPAPPPVPKAQEAMKIPPKEVKKTKPMPREEYYTIQTGAFRDLEYARELFEILKKDGFDAYLTKIDGKKRGTFHKVFVGHFRDEKEGARFLEEKEILNNYPGSFVRKGPSFKIHQLIEGSIM